MKVIAIIPARGGSKGIPRKNIRLMLNMPLISYSINNAKKSKYNLDVVVSTDDYEIAKIACFYGAQVIMRPENLSSDIVTLDPVIFHAVNEIEKKKGEKYDIVITMQPTSPLLKSETLDSAIEYFLKTELDTILSAMNKPHLSWTEKNDKIVPNYEKRLNRQYLPKNLIETGAFLISKRAFIKEQSRFGPKTSIYEIPESESIDIDSPQDWWVAEKELLKKNIIIRVEGYSEIGLGHIYRGLLLAYNLIDHNVKFVISKMSELGILKIKNSNFPYVIIEDNNDITDIIKEFKCDILINDILDTDEKYIKSCKNTGVRVINFEDLGSGSRIADAVINDLYEKKNELNNHYWGSDYYCIRDEFMIAKESVFRETVKEVLVIFGGTDPCNLTNRILNVIKKFNNKNIHYTFILGMGYKKDEELLENSRDSELNMEIIKDVKMMTHYMEKADIAISSQGRTMLELASMAVPTILLAQNEREQHHEFGYLHNGFINLGLGSDVDDNTIGNTLLWLINSPQIRKQMREQMRKKDLRSGINIVKNIILNDSV